jgi:hypothetical protein
MGCADNHRRVRVYVPSVLPYLLGGAMILPNNKRRFATCSDCGEKKKLCGFLCYECYDKRNQRYYYKQRGRSVKHTLREDMQPLRLKGGLSA